MTSTCEFSGAGVRFAAGNNDLSENGQAELFRDGVHLAVYRDAEELVKRDWPRTTWATRR